MEKYILTNNSELKLVDGDGKEYRFKRHGRANYGDFILYSNTFSTWPNKQPSNARYHILEEIKQTIDYGGIKWEYVGEPGRVMEGEWFLFEHWSTSHPTVLLCEKPSIEGYQVVKPISFLEKTDL